MSSSKIMWLGLVASLSTALAACGGSGGVSGGGTSSSAEESGTQDDVASVSSDAGGESADAAVTESGPTEEAMPLACSNEVTCSEPMLCRSGVCLDDPSADEVLALTDATGLDPYPASVPVDLSCMDEEPAAPEGPATVTLYGAVTRFGSGLITRDIQVQVFDASQWDPSACESEATIEARLTCYSEYGEAKHADKYGISPLGEALSVAAPEPSVEVECEGHADCTLGYECIEDDVQKTCQEQFGLYEIPLIPTNTPLVIRSRATTYTDKWHDVYMFGVYLYADQVNDGRYHYDVTMVSEGQWQLTANIAGLSISEGKGVIGGRVRDCRVEGLCTDSEGGTSGACVLDSDCDSEATESCVGGRASWPLGGVAIGLAEPAAEIVYFNNLEDDTVPLDFRTTTNILGRYAALDVPAGQNRIAGVARLNGEVVSVGGAGVYVVPDALSIIGWPGQQPHWKQE